MGVCRGLRPSRRHFLPPPEVPVVLPDVAGPRWQRRTPGQQERERHQQRQPAVEGEHVAASAKNRGPDGGRGKLLGHRRNALERLVAAPGAVRQDLIAWYLPRDPLVRTGPDPIRGPAAVQDMDMPAIARPRRRVATISLLACAWRSRQAAPCCPSRGPRIRGHLRRRHGIRRHRSVRVRAEPHSRTRPHGGRGVEADLLLRGRPGLHAVESGPC